MSIVISPELFDEMEREWVHPEDPVFKLVPTAFEAQVTVLYNRIGNPEVSSLTIWDVYSHLLDAFRSLPSCSDFERALASVNEVVEEDIPLLDGLNELRHGDNVV